MLSAIAVPSLVMRSASQAGTCPPCRGKSANPERFMAMAILLAGCILVVVGDTLMNNPQKLLPLLAALCSLAFAAGQPPKLRLAEVQDIAPASYRVELTLDPGKDRFTGVIDINVVVKKPVDTIWLNAKKISVEAASMVSGGKTWQAKTVPGGNDFLGLQLDSALPAGPAEIKI